MSSEDGTSQEDLRARFLHRLLYGDLARQPAPEPDWLTCPARVAGVPCTGVLFDERGRCLAHLDESGLAEALAGLRPGADLDARGTRFTRALLIQVLAAVTGDDGRPHLGAARFDFASFVELARFDRVRFGGLAVFEGARFSDFVAFNGAQFDADAVFVDAHFGGVARFEEVQFNRDAWFIAAQFDTRAAGFDGAQFGQDAVFDGARFNIFTSFMGARFSLGAGFGGVEFSFAVDFLGAQFDRTEHLGPMTVGDRLSLERAEFGRPVQVEVAAKQVSLAQASFAAHATVRLRYAEAVLDGLVSAGPVTVTGAAEPFALLGAGPGPIAADETLLTTAGLDAGAAVLSLRGTDASRLVLVDLDLSRCEFAGAHHLDQLRIEGRCTFIPTPGWVRLTRWRLPILRYTRRQVLAEELTWRHAHGWMGARERRGGSRLDAERLTAVYRQLRKAQEDAKNEPGAADFYYGEMEMRRHARSTPAGERLILTLYWALSGYGLRATRALVALLIVLALGTAGLATVGFAPSQRVEYHPVAGATGPAAYRQVSTPGSRPGWAAAFEYSIDSATSLLRTPQAPPLTPAGRAMEIVIRLLGPLLLGLALLAVRNRVKR
ncbi:MAG TPA: pentapeptide repeat-containing protein [Micromonosporaceae bacterium]|nr:pentapeptide repeat-containing protein [Micromonosporaceae bacterium]